MTCPRCKSSGLVQIGVNVAESRLTMRSCSTCDVRWWDSDGESLDLTDVLELATRR